METQARTLTIVCPACPPTKILSFEEDAEAVRCDVCGKRYDLLTRTVQDSHTQRIDASRTRYTFMGVEAGGRLRPRTFDAQPNIGLRSASIVTLVYRGDNLIGVADQTASYWYPVLPLPQQFPNLARLLGILTVVCLVLVFVQTTQLVNQSKAFLSSSASAAAILVVVLLFLAAPLLLFVARSFLSTEEKRYLPTVLDTNDVFFEDEQ